MIYTCLIWKGSTETLTCKDFIFITLQNKCIKVIVTSFNKNIQFTSHIGSERGEDGGREKDRIAKLFWTANLESFGKQWLDNLTQFILAKASTKNVSPPAPCRLPHASVYIFQTQILHQFLGQNKNLHTTDRIS